MDHTNRSRAEAWLRYADDLRLGPFYRDRVGQPIMESAPTETVSLPAAASASRPDPAPAPAPKPAAAFVPPVTGPSLFEERIEGDTLDRIRADIGPNCTRCKLHKSRTKIVFGVGNPKAQLVFVGEGPGHDEDVQGEPFVGRAGQLLTDIIERGMGMARREVYICNVIKCRPPENRNPEPDEVAACEPFMIRQIELVRPRIIVGLGTFAVQALLKVKTPIGRLRGVWQDVRGIPMMPTFHPAYLLRNPNDKRLVWADVQQVLKALGRPLPRRGAT